MNPPPNPPNGGKSAEELRRNTLNMEKMIKKNVKASGARPGGMKRGLAVVEFFKQQQQQQQQQHQQQSTHDDSEGTAAKRAKKEATSASATSATSAMAPGSSLRGGQASSSLVGPPATPLIPSAASAAISASMTTTQRGSPLRTSTSASSAIRASPLRAASVRASPLRSSARASPLRQVFTSPSRRVVAPRLPEVTTSGGIHSTPVLNLDQLDAPSATPLKPPTLPSKSPFQSFQSKLSGGSSRGVVKTPSPARPSPPPARRSTPITSAPQLEAEPLRRAASIGTVTSAGIVDLMEDKAATPELPKPSIGSSAAHPVVLTTPPPKPLARNLFASTTKASVATKSLCFSTEGVASSLDVSPDGECVVVAFTDGSVRLYEMDSTVPSDRHGYLLGHLDEESNLSSAGAHLRVKITSDGRYAFVGCRTGPRVMMSIHLHHYRDGKDTGDDDMDQLQKTFHANTRLRGFSTAMLVPTAEANAAADLPRSYYVLCGLGVGSLNLWQFMEPKQRGDVPEWKFLYSIQANGNTAVIARFLPQDPSSSLLQIATKCEDKNIRVWNLERSTSADDENASHHVVQGHYDVSNSKDVTSFYGIYAYAIAPTGEACRFRIPSEPVAAVRTYFETERFEMAGGNSSASKSRRSNIILESIYASDDGQAVVAVSDEGIFYYTNQAPADGSSDTGVLRIIGRNSSLNAQFKSPMKVYKPLVTKPSGEKYVAEAVMAVITNPQYEEDGEEGYVNVDLTETWAARWMKPSLGNDCWVCGVRNIRHWQTDNSQPVRPKPVVEKPRVTIPSTKQSYRPSPSSASKPPTPKLPKNSAASSDSSPGSPVAAAKSSSSLEAAARPTKPPSGRSADDSSSASKKQKSKPAPVKRLDVDAASVFTGEDQRSQQEQLVQELARYKERYNQIVTEWQRRLKGERQMRRLWKQRETEFEGQLHETLVKLDDAEQQVVALREGQKDAEKKFIFEKLKAEQQSSVKVRYEQLCEQMQERMVALEQQQRLMEQTSRALLQEVDRHVQHTKQSVNGLVDRQQNECILCKDRTAVTAIVPCGHLCFCEEDADVYRRNFRGSEQITCPICQREMISMLRIY